MIHFSQAQIASDFNSVDEKFKEIVVSNNPTGLASVVIKGDEIIWQCALGNANIESKTPMSIDRIMPIASISKTFTATATMQLWEQGLIDLKADVSEYVGFKVRNPKYPEVPISIQQILTHTSSISDNKFYDNSYTCGDPTIPLKDWVTGYLTPNGKYFSRGSFLKTKPGEKYEYSNVAFGLLGYIVESVSKTPFNVYCKQNIFHPLGMEKTGWFIHEIDTNNYITQYSEKWYPKHLGMGKLDKSADNKEVPLCVYSFPNYPDGLIRTSVRELSYFMTAFINDGTLNGKSILKKSTIDKMLTPQIEDNDWQGLCFYRTDSLWGHSGGDPGVRTNMLFSRDQKHGYIAFENGQKVIWNQKYRIITKMKGIIVSE